MSAMYFDTQLLSKYRSQLMGLATLMIIACHAPASGVALPGILTRILELGNFGVDMFLFLSGLGCYYSLSKCNTGYGEYWVRRIKRVFIPYLIISIPFCAFYLIVGRDSLLDAFYWLSTLEYWLFHKGAWFVSLIIPIYIVSPLLYNIIVNKRSYITVAIVLSFSVSLTLLSSYHSDNSIVCNIQSALSRVPSFMLGLAVAPLCMKATKIHSFLVFAPPPTLLYLVLAYLGLRAYSTWAIMPLVMYICCIICNFVCTMPQISNMLAFFGTISLESYLTNIYLNSLLRFLIPAYISSSIFNGRYLEYAMVIVLGVIMSYYFKKLTHYLTNGR